MKEKHPKPIALSAQSSTKRTMICMKAKDKLKRQKIVHSGSDQIKQALPSTDDHKVKRVSILDLCNEIAGEIESDTVEVKKDVSSPQSVLKEGSVITEMKTENTESAALHPRPTEESPVNTSKRFFPSKNPLKIKCKLDRKLSPALKNSKWTKIKLKKANNFSHNNVMRNHAVLPSLDMINVKSKVSQIRQPEACTSSTPRSLNKLTDKTLPVRINISKPNLPELKKTKIVPTKQKKYSEKSVMENGLLENHIQQELEIPLDEGFRLHLDSSPESTPVKISTEAAPQRKIEEPEDAESKGCVTKQLFNSSLTDQMAVSSEKGNKGTDHLSAANSSSVSTDANIQKEVKKLKEAEKDSNKQPIIDAGQKRFGAISCNVCGMLYTASNPEDETQHLLFHNQFISAVKYVGWKKERIVAEYPDGKIIMVLPDDPKYALRKVKEVREMVDNDLGFQQAPLRLHSRTKTLLFISNDKKVVGCLIAEHIQWGYRVIDDLVPPDGKSEKEQALSERVKAWCCSTTPEPAICGISRIWVFSMKRRKKIASRMLECLRSHFIYGSYLNKDEIAFSDPTPDGKLFATHYCGTSQFLVYNFVNGHHQMS
ncbi:N-acetyltransferase ESCO1 [Rhinophrynus dorsalis]